jgi:integrase
VFPDRDGYTGQISLRDPDNPRIRRRPKVHAATESECWAKLDALREEYRKTGTVARQDTTVETVVREFLRHPPAEWRSPISREVYAAQGQRIIAAVGKLKLVRLTPGQVDAMLRDMAGQGLSRSTIDRTRSLLVRAIRRAERDGLVPRNVAALSEMPAAPARVSKAMTLEQVGALLKLELSPWWRAYITAGVMTGLRPGELLGLRWEDLDLDQGVLKVRQSMKRGRGQGRAGLAAGALKTAQSRRTLRMPAPVRAALGALRREQAADRLKLGEHYTQSGLVFADNAGRPVWPQGTGREFQALCERAGLGRDWTPRELRHTFVSQLSAAGVDLETVADLVGHANSNITRAVYRHQLADKVGTAAAVFDRIYEVPS